MKKFNDINDLTREIIGGAIEVHKNLGPGLLEKCYEKALAYELKLRGLKVDRQQRVPIMYKGIDLAEGEDEKAVLRYDLLVEDTVVIEIKSVEEMKRVYYRQLRTYLKFLDKKVGLLINFNVNTLMRDGFSRVIL